MKIVKSDYVEVKNKNVGNAQITTSKKSSTSSTEVPEKSAKAMLADDDLFNKLDSLTKEIDEAHV